MVQLTESAQEEAKKLLSDKEKGILRISVKGGGCAGFTYDVKIDNEKSIDKSDRIFDYDGVKVVCDFNSFSYLNGTIIDYSTGLVGAGFTFENPNASGSCGCGTSFSI